MEKEKMRLLFYLKKSTQNKNGKSPIMGRISIGRSMVQLQIDKTRSVCLLFDTSFPR